MASEKLKIYSKFELELLATQAGQLTLWVDLPTGGMKQVFQCNVPASVTVGGIQVRGTFQTRLPYLAQGYLVQCKYTPGTGQTCLYRGRIWGRELPGGQWQWFPLPVIETPVEFQPMSLPIPPTPEEWRELALAIPPTAEEWREMSFAVPPTAEEWRPLELPIKGTPDTPDWIDLEMDK